MKPEQAMTIFETLSQETRLLAFRLLVKAGPDGLAAGVIGSKLGIAHNTLSFHLSHLLNSGIVACRKQGRSVIYSANFGAVGDLIGFLVRDCCSSDFANIREDDVKGCSTIELFDCCSSASEILSNKIG